MATLTGKTIANTYKDLLQVSNNNDGLTETVQTISDGSGTNSALQLSNAAVNINGTFQLNGESLTVNASAINNMADIGSATGIIVVNSGSVYGRTLTAGAPVSITNANGTAGNPTITLASIANVSGSYGPFTNFGVNDYGQIVSATAVSTSVSVPTIRATELIAQTLTLSSDASVVGNLNVDGAFTVDGVVSAASDVAVSGSLYVTSNISVTGNLKSDFLYAVSASVDDMRIGTLNFTDVSVSAFTASNLTIVSAATLAGTDLGTKITALETSIGTANTRITSVSDFAVALSATMATSIGNTNTLIAATSAALATSIGNSNTLIAATSAALATSIGNSNTNITTNINAITSINSILGDGSGFATDAELQAVSAAMATSIANHLPLAGGTLTGALTTNGNITSTGNQITVGDNAAAGGSYDSVLHLLGDASSGFKLSTNSANTAFNLEREYFGWQGGLTMKRDTGNLGIGTTSPASLLDINGADGIPFTLRGTSSSAALGMGLTSTSVIIQAQTTAAEATALVFKTAPSSGTETEAMRITGDGNVGIGETSPDTELHITASGVSMTLENQNAQKWSIGQAVVADEFTIRDETGTANRFHIDGSGNVGIGTTSPTNKLEVVGTQKTTSQIFVGSASDDNYSGGIINLSNTSRSFNLSADPNNAGASTFMSFSTDGSEAMRITGDGELVIGATSPTSNALLTISGAGSTTGSIDPTLAVVSTGTGGSDDSIIMARIGGTSANSYIFFGDSGDANAGEIRYAHTGDSMRFTTAAAERMRIDSSGNLGLGVTSVTSGYIADIKGDVFIQDDSTEAKLVVKSNTGGAEAQVRAYAGVSVHYGSTNNTSVVFEANSVEAMRVDNSGHLLIGTTTGPYNVPLVAHTGTTAAPTAGNNNASAMFTNVTSGQNAEIGIIAHTGQQSIIDFGDTSDYDVGRILYDHTSNYLAFRTAAAERMRINSSTLRPGADNSQSLGDASYRWSEVFAGNGTINTSDQREKTEIADLDEAERRVAIALKGLVKKYRFKDAVAAKGDNARIHVGVIAQEVVAAFSVEGLDATKYALLCHDEWDAVEAKVNDDGEVVTPGLEAGDRYGIRYDQLLAFIISAL